MALSISIEFNPNSLNLLFHNMLKNISSRRIGCELCVKLLWLVSALRKYPSKWERFVCWIIKIQNE
jgi:hypothetical protein